MFITKFQELIVYKKIDMGTFLRYKKQIFYRKRVIIIVFFTLVVNNLYGQDPARNFTSIEKYIEYVYGKYVRKNPNQRVNYVKKILSKPEYLFAKTQCDSNEYYYDMRKKYAENIILLTYLDDIYNITDYKRAEDLIVIEPHAQHLTILDTNLFNAHIKDIIKVHKNKGLNKNSTPTFIDITEENIDYFEQNLPNSAILLYLVAYFNNTIFNRIIFIEKYANQLDFEISNLFKTDLDTLLGVETPQYLDFYSKLNKNEFKKAKKIWLKAINE